MQILYNQALLSLRFIRSVKRGFPGKYTLGMCEHIRQKQLEAEKFRDLGSRQPLFRFQKRLFPRFDTRYLMV